MGNLQVALPDDRRGYAIAASSEAVLFPAANAQVPERQFVPWQSVGTTGQWLRADCGTAVPIVGVDLRNVNAPGYVVETSTDALAWTTRASGTLPINPWTPRYQGIVSFASVTARYVRVTFSGILAGHTAVQVGGLSVLGALNTFDQNFSARSVDPQQRTTVLDDIDQVNVENELAMVYRFSKEHWYRSQGNALGLLQRMARVGAGTVLLHENNGNVAESYLCRLVSRSEFRVDFRTVGHEMVWRERV